MWALGFPGKRSLSLVPSQLAASPAPSGLGAIYSLTASTQTLIFGFARPGPRLSFKFPYVPLSAGTRTLCTAPLDVCIARVGPVPRTQALALGASAHPLPVQHHLLGGTVTWVEQPESWQDARPRRLGYFKNSILGKASRLGSTIKITAKPPCP